MKTNRLTEIVIAQRQVAQRHLVAQLAAPTLAALIGAEMSELTDEKLSDLANRSIRAAEILLERAESSCPSPEALQH